MLPLLPAINPFISSSFLVKQFGIMPAEVCAIPGGDGSDAEEVCRYGVVVRLDSKVLMKGMHPLT